MSRRLAAAVAAAVLGGACSGGSPPGRVLSFVTRDGFSLVAEEFGTGSRGVVLAHAADATRASWSGFARILAARGYHALTFDFRGYGASPGDRSASTASRDVTGAADLLRARGADRVVLVGTQLGGLACLKSAAGSSAVAGVATISVPPEVMGLSAGSEVRTVLVPKLYMASEGDVPAMAEGDVLLAASPEPRTLRTYPGSAHGTALLDDGRARDDLLAFLHDTLPSP